jgi:hypothetical protein
MRVRDFLMLVRERLESLLPAELRSFRARIRFNLLQVYYEHPSLHYEVWPQRKSGRIEIGLHCEGEREENYGWAAVLAEHMPQMQAALGPSLELEEWTPTWTRLHQPMPLGSLNDDLAGEVAQRIAALIETVQPILEECRPRMREEALALPPRPASRGLPRYLRHRRRGRLRRRPFP